MLIIGDFLLGLEILANEPILFNRVTIVIYITAGRKMPLLLIFIIIPLIELAVILKVNSFIGIGWTLGLIIITAFVGVKLLRQQGISTLLRANQKMQQGQMPAQEMAEGFLLALAGALLLTPGFVTDAAGFILLVPATRKALVHKVMAFIAPRMMSGASFQSTSTFEAGSFKDVYSQEGRSQGSQEKITVIEGEYTKEDK
jgi:UPF0716 protein FxsA